MRYFDTRIYQSITTFDVVVVVVVTVGKGSGLLLNPFKLNPQSGILRMNVKSSFFQHYHHNVCVNAMHLF